jgi:hypothetical protein
VLGVFGWGVSYLNMIVLNNYGEWYLS